MPEKKSKKEEYAKELEKLANEICEEKIKDKQCLDSFAEGYKAGFRDGYKAAREEMKGIMLSQMPPEIRKQIEEGAQPGWGIW